MSRPAPGVFAACLSLVSLAITSVGVAGPVEAHPQRGQADAGQQAVASLVRARSALATPGTDFTVRSVLTDADGSTHVRLDRSYRGLPVLGGDLVVHQSEDGAFRGVNQSYARGIAVSTQPRVARGKAGLVARRHQARGVVTSYQGRQSKQTVRLVVDATGAEPRLAWEVTVLGLQRLKRGWMPTKTATTVDARTGKVLGRHDLVHTAEGSGTSMYSGTVPVQVTPAAWWRQSLTDATRANSQTFDLKGGTGKEFWCWLFGACGNGQLVTASSPTAFSGPAVDAAYGRDQTWDFFAQVLGRNSYDGKGAPMNARVNYMWANAFWEGDIATFGRGDSTTNSVVDLDVVAHEFSHGLTRSSADLVYSGESGGLNEATSDIFGTMVEFRANNPQNVPDYFIGEKAYRGSTWGFRRMDDPVQDKVSAGCWAPFVANLDVHYSSGVANHFFYLLAEGSGAKTINGVAYNSPTCDGSTVTGIGLEKAGAIWYRALTTYMTSTTDYQGARQATLSAAADLYGAGSPEALAVANAWTAVSVS